MSKEIKALYHKKGVPAPKGRGIHKKAFHQQASSIMQSQKGGGVSESEKRIAYATAMKNLGAEDAVKKSHRRSAYKRKMDSM